MNKSSELCLHISKKDKFIVLQRWKHHFQILWSVFCNCNRLLFDGRSLFAAPKRLPSQWRNWQTMLLSVQCSLQHWTEYKFTLASIRPSVRPVPVHPATTANIVSYWAQFWTDLHQIWNKLPLNTPNKILLDSPRNGHGQGQVTP